MESALNLGRWASRTGLCGGRSEHLGELEAELLSCTASLQGLEKTTRERIGEYKPSPLMFFKGWGLALEQQRGRSWLSNSHS